MHLLKVSNGEIEEIPISVESLNPQGIVVKEPTETSEYASDLDKIIQTSLDLGVNVLLLGEEGKKDFYPADEYVFANGRYVPRSCFGGLGEGGYVVPGNGFVLVNEKSIFDTLFMKDSFPYSYKSEKENERVFKKIARETYNVEEVYIMPSVRIDRLWKDIVYGHIDLFIGSVPEANILSVNSRYYKENKDKFDEIKERFNPDIFLTNPDHFENNYRIVYNEQGELYVLVRNSKDLISNLKDRGLNVIPIKGYNDYFTFQDASIHCLTNVFHNVEVLDQINQLNSGRFRITPYKSK